MNQSREGSAVRREIEAKRVNEGQTSEIARARGKSVRILSERACKGEW